MSSGSSIDALSGSVPRDAAPAPRPAPVPPPVPKSRAPRPMPVPIPVPKPIPLPPADKSVVDPSRKPAERAAEEQPLTWRTILSDALQRRELVVTTVSSILHMVLIIVLALITIGRDRNRLPTLVASPDVEPVKPDLIESPIVETPSAAAGPQVRAITPPVATVKAPINMGVSNAPRTLLSLNDLILNDSARAGGAGGLDTVSFFGSTTMAKKVIFVVDNSTSMEGGRWPRAKEEVLTAVSNLSPEQRFFVFFFSDRDYPMLAPNSPSGLVGLDTKTWESFLNWVNALPTFGDTLAESALRKAYAMKPDVIYLLTDGEFGDGTFDFLMKMKYSKVRVNTIGFETSPAGSEVLRKIAETLKGEYTEVRLR